MADGQYMVGVGAERSFQQFFGRSPRSTQLLAPDGRTLAVNAAWERLWGATLADLGDYNIRQDPQLREKGIATHLERAFAGEPVEIPPIAYLLDRGPATGETRWVRATATPILDDGGEVAFVVLVHEDVTETVAANEGLRRTQELLEESQRSARVGSWAWHLGTGELEWSEELFRLYGLDPAEGISYDRFLVLVHPDDRDHLTSAVQRAVADRGAFDVIHRIRLGDGTERTLHARGRVVCDADGESIRLVGSGQDVTDRLTAQAALRASEDRYRTLFESIDVGFCTIEVLFDGEGNPIDYRFLEVNPAFEHQTGLAGALGRRVRELAPELEAHWFETYGRIAKTRRPERFTNEARVLDGRWFDVYAFPVGDDGDNQVGILFTDVTARKRAEEDAARLAAIVASSRDAIIGRTLDGVITSWNPAATELFGYAATEIIGWNISRLLPPDRKDELTRIEKQIARGERIAPFETVRMHKDGTAIAVETALSPITDASGRVVGVSSTLRDARERQALREQQQAFLEAVSHDLKNPLTTVRVNAQLLRRRVEKGETPATDWLAETAATIVASTKRMDAQLGELQDALRLRSGHALDLRSEPTDLVALASAAVTDADASAPGHRVTMIGPEESITGQWDALRLRRVVDNLLNNAIKYSHDGGDIEVTVCREDREDGAWALLTVRDRGVGIPSADLPHLFQRYRRGSNVAGRSPGAGIGLAGARQIVEQHGGTIRVESEEGWGTTVTVWLPLSAP